MTIVHEPRWDDRNVVNTFLHPRCDFLPSYWLFHHTETSALERHPVWRWWCHFIHHLLSREHDAVCYWHRYWAHMLQRPAEAAGALWCLHGEEPWSCALRVIQGILGEDLWAGGNGCFHHRVLRNDGKALQGCTLRLLVLSLLGSPRLTETQMDVLCRTCDHHPSHPRVVLLSDGRLRRHPSRVAAVSVSDVFRRPANLDGLRESLSHTIGVARDPEALSEEAVCVIAECYRRIGLRGWNTLPVVMRRPCDRAGCRCPPAATEVDNVYEVCPYTEFDAPISGQDGGRESSPSFL